MSYEVVFMNACIMQIMYTFTVKVYIAHGKNALTSIFSRYFIAYVKFISENCIKTLENVDKCGYNPAILTKQCYVHVQYKFFAFVTLDHLIRLRQTIDTLFYSLPELPPNFFSFLCLDHFLLGFLVCFFFCIPSFIKN